LIQFLIRKICFEFIPTLFLLSIIVFLLVHITPGDPVLAMLGAEATPELIEAMRAQYDLDKPVIVQYTLWLKKAITGDLGRSIQTRQPVATMIAGQLGVTVYLTICAMLLVLVIAIPCGVVSAVHKNGILDKIIMFFTSLCISFPNFFTAILLILFLSVKLDILPITGYVSPFEDFSESLKYIILPALSLSLTYVALLSRLVRSDMLDVLSEDFIRTARAKGIRESKTVIKHALRNSMLPAINLSAMNFAYLLGGSIIIESIFAIPGIGRLMIRGIYDRDFPLIQGVTLLVGFFFLMSSVVADVLGVIADPRMERRD